MSDLSTAEDNTNLENALDEGYRETQREVAVNKIAERLNLTLGKLVELTTHPEYGPIVADISLQEILDNQLAKMNPVEEEAPRKRGRRKKTASKKNTKKVASKKSKKAPKATGKADRGKPKPRLDYDTGMKEVLACLKAAKEPVGRSAIEEATGFTGVQVRAFCKKLRDAGKIRVVGNGGRGTKYEVA